jgi:hypothetical protein
VCESQLAANNDAERSSQLLVQLGDFLPQEFRVVSRVHSVVSVRGGDHHSYAVVGRRAAHLDRFFEAVRTIVYFGENVTMNVYHLTEAMVTGATGKLKSPNPQARQTRRVRSAMSSLFE